MRRIVPLIATIALLGGLTACTATPDPVETTAAADVDVCSATSGAQSEAVKVTGDFGAEPTVDFAAGLSTDETQRSIVIEGDGAEVAAKATATVAYSLYNGTTGKIIDSYGWTDGQSVNFTANAASVLAGIAKTIGCTTVGSRVVSVVSPADAFGADGYEDLGIAGGDTIVFVMDIKGIVPSRADGVDQPATDGFPAVTLAEDGTPTVTVPETDPPADLRVAVLKKGDGAVVAEGATVTLQYQGVEWDTGKVFDQSWGSGPTPFTLSSVIPGFSQAVVGQTVGSQVIAVIPPALAYGEAGGDNTSELAGKTLVFVIDILAVG